MSMSLVVVSPAAGWHMGKSHPQYPGKMALPWQPMAHCGSLWGSPDHCMVQGSSSKWPLSLQPEQSSITQIKNQSAGKFRFKTAYTEELSSPDIADALPNKQHLRYKGGT